MRQDDKAEYKRKVIETELYEYQWFCAAHEDTKHKHTHFVASRINLVDGRCIPTWQDKERSHRICREIEQEHGLQQLQSYYEIERRSTTRGQSEEWEKTGIPPVMVEMQNAIDQEAVPGRSLNEVLTALQEHHRIEAKVGYYKGKAGIVFEKADSQGQIVRMSGSQLGRGYTLPAVERRLEREIEIEPPGAELELEAVEDSDPLEQVMRKQTEYAERLAPQIQEIWEREKTGRPKLQTATFDEYQIKL
ncbi:relaxase/mobilization nuclease domain-containing protein, partial [bacterium]|nr:relaxase/mobilization nuclease domain-containing protein [bacterium]